MKGKTPTSIQPQAKPLWFWAMTWLNKSLLLIQKQFPFLYDILCNVYTRSMLCLLSTFNIYLWQWKIYLWKSPISCETMKGPALLPTSSSTVIIPRIRPLFSGSFTFKMTALHENARKLTPHSILRTSCYSQIRSPLSRNSMPWESKISHRISSPKPGFYENCKSPFLSVFKIASVMVLCPELAQKEWTPT